MGKMIDSLNAIAPNTTFRFISAIMFEYGKSSEEFEELPLQKRLVMVKRWLGYSMTEEPSLETDAVISKIKGLFEEHEKIILKYPEGAPDVLKSLKYMNNIEKTKYLSEFSKRIIKICLHHALVPGYNLIRPSLKDSLIERQLTKQEQSFKQTIDKYESEQKFWTDAMKNFNSNEIVPF